MKSFKELQEELGGGVGGGITGAVLGTAVKGLNFAKVSIQNAIKKPVRTAVGAGIQQLARTGGSTKKNNNFIGPVREESKGYGEERFCELCGKKEYKEECSYGPKMWDMFTVSNFSKSVVVPGKSTYEEVNWRNELAESYLRLQERGRTYTIIFNWRGRTLKVQMFFNKFSRPTREEVRQELNKIYPGPIVLYYNPSKKEPTLPFMFAGTAGGDANEPRRN